MIASIFIFQFPCEGLADRIITFSSKYNKAPTWLGVAGRMFCRVF
jgi:hypothetical protein